jgi:Domain of unknown function (DUF4139)
VCVRGRILIVCLLVFGAVAVEAQRPASDTAEQLPVRRVVLYKSGVGFFEHVGSVAGNASVTIQFTTAQLNDVLQSLTALDLDGGSIANISYNSIAPIEQRLAALRVPLAGDANVEAFYQTLRGARVSVRNGAAETTGRIFSVERKQRTRTGGVSETVTELTVIADEGSVRTIELTPGTAVRLEERDVRDDISSYLGIVASSRGEDVRRMVLAATGTGTRRLAVSYISEVPIWKSTYRLVLPDGNRKPVLQGWAVVDNTIGQDWSNVELSLVAGAPQSFVQPISQPYYVRRPVVPLPSSVLLQPQTHAGTLTTGERERKQEELDRLANEELAKENLVPRAAAGGGRGGAGFRSGVAGGVVGGVPAPPPPPPPPAPVIDYMPPLAAAADAQDLGDLFEYKLRQPVTIRKNESALVPILTTEVDAERVSVWSRGIGSGRPLRGVWLTNSSALTLDGGSFSVIDANAFAGEGLVESVKPGEKRLVSYGSDLAVLVKAAPGDASGRVTKVVVRDGLMIASQEDRATVKYTARNEDAAARTLVIEHPLRSGWSVGTDPAPAETSVASARYRLPLPPKQEASLVVTERHAGDTTYRLVDLDERIVLVLVRGGVQEAALRRALQPLTDKRAELVGAEARLAAINGQIAEIGSDQQRVRENMKALRGSEEEKALTQRYTRQLNEQEDRLAALREDLKKATADRDARRRELSELAGRLTFEISG